MQTDLFGYVLGELRSRRFKLTEVSAGAKVPYETLKKIALGTTPNPGVRHVQALADFFLKHPPADSAAPTAGPATQPPPAPAAQEFRDAA